MTGISRGHLARPPWQLQQSYPSDAGLQTEPSKHSIVAAWKGLGLGDEHADGDGDGDGDEVGMRTLT